MKHSAPASCSRTPTWATIWKGEISAPDVLVDILVKEWPAMPNKIAVSLALPDTGRCLARLQELAPQIALAEIRLDLMDSFDLPRLIAEAACPLIITCRPPREGGQFRGNELERRAILKQALNLGCAYLDIEWDCFALFARHGGGPTRLIVSRHWQDQMPDDLLPFYQGFQNHADVVKLVGLARQPAEMLPVFRLLQQATTPVIGLAMGQAGQLTRLLAPCFPNCLLTYGAASAEGATASGQLSVSEMVERYHLDHAGPQTTIHLHLCIGPGSAERVIARNASAAVGEHLYVPLIASPEQATALLPGLRACLPQLLATADPGLLPSGFPGLASSC
jgi:3-dehydroquinate dehydratase type I